ncbi:MAG TPA: DUF2203 domain-containing protein [Candidatus Limnocylindria bacterium]|nr:DUF2203 domain-containing protein [Candidatus Limnocylindria bacterium]
MPQFTHAEAEALLPRVQPLLEDLKRRKTTYDARPSAPVASEIEALLRELAELGVEVKDMDTGLVDFRTLRSGEEVYLCWRLGEGDRIAWWHTVEGGFAARRPLVEN